MWCGKLVLMTKPNFTTTKNQADFVVHKYKSVLTAYYNKQKRLGIENLTAHELINSYLTNNFRKVDLDMFVYLMQKIVISIDKFLKRKNCKASIAV